MGQEEGEREREKRGTGCEREREEEGDREVGRRARAPRAIKNIKSKKKI